MRVDPGLPGALFQKPIPALREFLRENLLNRRLQLTRLETRTKECTNHASDRVEKPDRAEKSSKSSE